MITNERLKEIKIKAKETLFDKWRTLDGKSHIYIDEKCFNFFIDKLIEENAADGFVEP